MTDTDNLPNVYVTEKQAARLLALSHRTLQAWRRMGAGPSFTRFGRSVRYRQNDVLSWADRHPHTKATIAQVGPVR